MQFVKSALLGLALLGAVAGFAADQIISRPPARNDQRVAEWFTKFNAGTFARLPEARELIDADGVNYDVLDAAVFHETNRRRQEKGLPALKHDVKARAAAKMQSQDMAKGSFVGHENPNPKRKTMSDRAELAGLRSRVLAENVASSFGRRYKSG